MPDTTVLRALADRCEREEPSVALDAAIAIEMGAEDGDLIPAYTTSLDAAVTLVPEGWNRSVEFFTFDAVMPYRKSGAKASVWRDSRNPRERIFNQEAPTKALALCAASLRARAALSDGEA